MLTEHLQGPQQRPEELLAVDHIRRNHRIGPPPPLRQLVRPCDAPGQLMGKGCAACCVYGVQIEFDVVPDEILPAMTRFLRFLSQPCPGLSWTNSALCFVL